LKGTANCIGGYGYAYGANLPTYRFWIFDLTANRWSMVQDYSTNDTYNWNTAGIANGDYKLELDVKSYDEPNSIGYDFVINKTYHVGPPPCTASLAISGGSGPTTGATGGTYVMTGSSTGCPNPTYRFWILDPGGPHWSMVQDYGLTTANTHTWAGTYYLGAYKMEVDVRDASNTSVAYEAVNNVTFTLTGCTAATISGTPPNTSVTGAVDVTLTATATCPGTPTYRFWILDAGGSHWSIVQDFSPTATYTWAKANQRAGVSKIEVDVRDKGSAEVYEFATQNQTYTFT
jgi:N-acetylmuramoyl-L-alanine amidase